MNKKVLLLIALFFLGYTATAQQLAMYNQYHLTPRIYNPSYVGFEKGVDISLIRNQKWGNYGEGFNANNLSVGFLLKDHHGLGINLYNDFAGITSKLRANLLYAYKIKLGDDMFLTAGAGLGIVDNRLDFSNAIVNDINDPVLSSTGKSRRTMFDLNVGLNFYWAGFKFGAAVPQVLGSKLIYGDMTSSYYTLERQILGNIGYEWRLNEAKDIVLRPEALINFTPGAPFQYNGGLYFEMEKYFWVGAMYKSGYAIGINVGVNALKNLKIGVAYDFQINSLATFNNAPNAEIMLRYSIPNKVEEVNDGTLTDSLMAANQLKLDSLKKVINNQNEDITDLNDTNQILEDSLAKWPRDSQVEVPIDDNSDVKSNSADHFIELNNNDSKKGYYVIGGAFAEKKNADVLVRKIKSKFPSARIIKNKRNGLYYVMLYYSTKKGEGLAYASYKANQLPDEETWILYYNRN
jgi:type IX secretion system PorP/SprF family membrane protein